MAKFEDNISPYISFVEGSAPSSPAATNFRLYYDSSDHLLKWKNSAGTVVPVMTNPMTTAGDTIYGGASGLPTRLAGGTSGYVLTSNGATSAPSWQAAAGGGASLLGVNQYAPASLATYSTTSGTLADVDATNMKVTFTAPASGNVLVRLNAWVDVGTANFLWVGLRESTTNLGIPTLATRGANSQQYLTAAIYLTGISAGSHTYKWSFSTDGSGTAGRILVADGVNSGSNWFPPAIMEVWAAP